MSDRIALIQHAGSGNHGCEAIVDSLVRMLPEERFLLLTNSSKEDERYLPAEVKARLDIEEEQHIGDHPAVHALYYGWRRVTGDRESFLRYRFRAATGREHPALAVCIGGDNYCYPEMVPDLILTNAMLHRQGTRTILVGCSIEPAMLEREDLRKDLLSYELITARESITYEALLGAGIPEERVRLCPDPAFTLPVAETGQLSADQAVAGQNLFTAGKGQEKVPEEKTSAKFAWQEGRTGTDGTGMAQQGTAAPDAVGLNLSPMAEHYSADKAVVYGAFRDLIRHILDTSTSQVLLIPHVIWQRSNDLEPLQKLRDEFRETGRVTLVPDQPAESLKAVISRCRLFVGARTHATIAAYSTGVPTLVLGYSVKAKGIARDLFGTEEHYVLPVQKLTSPEQLIGAYTWLEEHEEEIRQQLLQKMPDVKRHALENAAAVREAR